MALVLDLLQDTLFPGLVWGWLVSEHGLAGVLREAGPYHQGDLCGVRPEIKVWY